MQPARSLSLESVQASLQRNGHGREDTSCSMSFSPYALPARIDGVVMNGRKEPGQLTHSYCLVVVVVVTLVCVCVCVCVWIDGWMDGWTGTESPDGVTSVASRISRRISGTSTMCSGESTRTSCHEAVCTQCMAQLTPLALVCVYVCVCFYVSVCMHVETIQMCRRCRCHMLYFCKSKCRRKAWDFHGKYCRAASSEEYCGKTADAAKAGDGNKKLSLTPKESLKKAISAEKENRWQHRPEGHSSVASTSNHGRDKTPDRIGTTTYIVDGIHRRRSVYA